MCVISSIRIRRYDFPKCFSECSGVYSTDPA
jgi:hypothetical protein